MDIQKIISCTEHTLLSPTATAAEIRAHCDEAIEYGAATVCVPACYVREAADHVAGRIPIGTVIGFPHGHSVTGAKLFEAKTAMEDGAAEMDIAINHGYFKDGRFDRVYSEISGLRAMVEGRAALKITVQTALLTPEEKQSICLLVAQTGVEYIRLSTGATAGEAVLQDIALFRTHGGSLKIKVSGGIRSLQQAWERLEGGATRIGTSQLVPMLQSNP